MPHPRIRYSPENKRLIMATALAARARGVGWPDVATQVNALGGFGFTGHTLLNMIWREQHPRAKKQAPPPPAPPPIAKTVQIPQPRPRKERVFWTVNERETLIEQVYTLRQNQPDAPLHHLCNRVMGQWPAERRRAIASCDAVPWLVAAIADKFKHDRNDLALRRATPPPQPEIIHVQPDPAAVLAAMDTPALVAAVLARLTGQLDAVAALAKTNNELLHRVLAKGGAVVASVAPSVQKPRVCIVGLLAIQQREIENRFGGYFDFRFFESDRNIRDLPQCAYYLIATKFISHSWQDRIKDRDRLLYVNGGVSDFCRELDLMTKGGPVVNGKH